MVVAGPTAVGKTALAIRLAQEFETAVVSADSRQVYREMTIGTAKPSSQERATVPHYFIDILSVTEDYDAAAYAEDVLEKLQQLFAEYPVVILCGGSGLYIRAVCEGFDEMPEVPEGVRRGIIERYEVSGLEWLQEEVRRRDPELFETVDQRNPHRLIRALEVSLHTGKSIRSFQKSQPQGRDFDIVKIGLDLPRAELYRRIDERMEDMIARGLFDEARSLFLLRHRQALQTVGYQEIFGYLEDRYDRDECVRLLKRNSRRYAKRQLTWFRRDPDLTWFHPDETDAIISHIRTGQAR